MMLKIKFMKRYLILITLSLVCSHTFAQNQNFSLMLKANWQMQSVLKDTTDAAIVSQSKFEPMGWYQVSVPTTIIGGLLANKAYDFDPFYGMNFEKLQNTALDHPWWFRTTFILPASEKSKDVVLKLHGINYKANVWFNGVKIMDSTQAKNPFRIISLDITKYMQEGTNVLALEILRPFDPNKKTGDLAIDYADWIHYPPDYNAGILNDVELDTYDRVGIQYPLVTTAFDLPSLKLAHLSVDAVVTNYSANAQDVTVKGRINNNIDIEQQVHLNPHEIKNISFLPSAYHQLNVSNPRIWWPWQYGKPDLNRITLTVIRNGIISNTVSEDFGIRQIKTKLIDDQSREFIVNGKRIMLRGAAWSPDIFQRRSTKRQEQEIKLYRDMNMNVIRSEGKLEDDNFYRLCDKYGLLVISGWMCCGTWQYPENWDVAKRQAAMSADSTVMYWLRNKASVVAWFNGSDMPPSDSTVEKDYLKIESDLKWPNAVISSASAGKSTVSGFSGVKMAGPYEWVPPIYWETDTAKQYGGMWSFATEISPGPSIPPYESLVKFLPKDSIGYTTADWNYHCGTGSFGNTKIFNEALINRYGKVANIHSYLAMAQAQNYEAHRAMMEAYGLHKYHTATGVVQWMGSNPWPGLIWHTYDYYLYPAGTYFGIKKSLEPLHIMYSYADNGVYITNSLLQNFTGLTAEAILYNTGGTQIFNTTVSINVAADSVKQCFNLPKTNNPPAVSLLRLQLNDATGKVKSINWYWLSKQPDILNWKASNWFVTPEKQFADFSALQQLPKTTLISGFMTQKNGDSTIQTVTIVNTGKAVAFQVHLRVIRGPSGDDILPVFFSDNYISLAPGEKRVIKCSYANTDTEESMPNFIISAWNLDLLNCKATNLVKFEAALTAN
jgi:exo-1,4-beta-D-glucosaminidase